MNTQIGMSIDDIIAYEQGELDDTDTVAMFQRGINDGTVWRLQGHYGRTAKMLIYRGHCTVQAKELV